MPKSIEKRLERAREAHNIVVLPYISAHFPHEYEEMARPSIKDDANKPA
jgi:hypothetical protein